MAKKYFGSAKSGSPVPKRFTPKYVGGDERLRGESPMTQVVLCFESGGWSSPNLLPVCVLHMLLGGGSSFSPGGPGKGMYSRLYTNLLNKHHVSFFSLNMRIVVLFASATHHGSACFAVDRLGLVFTYYR